MPGGIFHLIGAATEHGFQTCFPQIKGFSLLLFMHRGPFTVSVNCSGFYAHS